MSEERYKRMSESHILTRQIAKTKRVAKIKASYSVRKKYYYDQVILNIFSLTSLSSYTTSHKGGLNQNDYRKLGDRTNER
jgi:hypothetical protein